MFVLSTYYVYASVADLTITRFQEQAAAFCRVLHSLNKFAEQKTLYMRHIFNEEPSTYPNEIPARLAG
uniref:Diguanylate cyclase n=1 Tax=Steinernema glaseri TaxID=37863 RepID=A0A1I7ZQJ1_9BILA